MQGPEILIPITFFASVASVIVLRGPIGKALADRLAGRAGHDDGELQALHGEVDDLRARLGEAEERLDFAERLLANQRDSGQLPGAARREPA